MMTKKWYEECGVKEYYYADDSVCIVHGDCREQSLSGISAVVTDPPYELGFMGKSWDSKGVSFQKETREKIRSYCLPGSLLLSFGGSRTQHRIACAIEDAGWEIRDTLMWVYGSGFPKSLDISKAIDKMSGAKRMLTRDGVVRRDGYGEDWDTGSSQNRPQYNIPVTLEAQLWDGYGTALKPAYEPIILAMNPLDKTFANNALKYGVAGLNIDECRVPTNGENPSGSAKRVFASNQYTEAKVYGDNKFTPPEGRFPANFLHDGSEEVLELFPQTDKSSQRPPTGKPLFAVDNENRAVKWNQNAVLDTTFRGHSDNGGSAARFFKKCGYAFTDLCLTLEHDIMNIWKIIFVNNAEKLLEIIQAITENTAQPNAVALRAEQNDPLVGSAVSHANICEILTALVLVKIRNLDFNKDALQAIRDCTSNYKECTLILNHVSSVANQGSIDITQTTINLLKLFGYVNPAITNYTQEIRESGPHRFLYMAKASKKERSATNNHPTVKPLSLMTYLCKLVKMPEYDIILDPFCGSGTTLLACAKLGIRAIGIDSDEQSCEIAAIRYLKAQAEIGK